MHTAGPWYIQHVPWGKEIDTKVVSREGRVIAVVNKNATDGDAACMAAAPEMLQTLQAIADLAHSITRPSGYPELCRALLDIEGIAAAVARKAKAE